MLGAPSGDGLRPVVEGIVGTAPPPRSPHESMCLSLLRELFKDGQQQVKVTKLHNKTQS